MKPATLALLSLAALGSPVGPVSAGIFDVPDTTRKDPLDDMLALIRAHEKRTRKNARRLQWIAKTTAKK